MRAFDLAAPESPRDSFDVTEQTPLTKEKVLLAPVGGFGISQQQRLSINELRGGKMLDAMHYTSLLFGQRTDALTCACVAE